MALLPAVADGDLATFGAALSAIQAITGRWFASVQGGTFAPGPSEELVRRMAEWGASGVGQSSWGPAVYGIVDGEAAGLTLAERVRGVLGAAGTVYEGPFPARARASGARSCGHQMSCRRSAPGENATSNRGARRVRREVLKQCLLGGLSDLGGSSDGE